MTTSHTQAGRQRTALSRLAPAVVTLGIAGGVVVAATGGLQPHNTRLHFTASGSTAPAGKGNGNGNTDPNTGCNDNGNCFGPDKQFKVTVQPKLGDSRKLWPGGSSTLQVTYSNPFAFPIQVASVQPTATLDQPKGSIAIADRCGKEFISVDPIRSTRVPGGGSAANDVHVTLVPSAPDACKQATWTITVNAEAVKE